MLEERFMCRSVPCVATTAAKLLCIHHVLFCIRHASNHASPVLTAFDILTSHDWSCFQLQFQVSLVGGFRVSKRVAIPRFNTTPFDFELCRHTSSSSRGAFHHANVWKNCHCIQDCIHQLLISMGIWWTLCLQAATSTNMFLAERPGQAGESS